jgi:hypothetical protein
MLTVAASLIAEPDAFGASRRLDKRIPCISCRATAQIRCHYEEVMGAMKEYRLVAWPQLRAPFDRIAHRRMLSDMSHRHMTLTLLVACSGIRRHEVRAFLDMLETRHLIAAREARAPDSLFGSLRPLGGWLRRALAASNFDR